VGWGGGKQRAVGDWRREITVHDDAAAPDGGKTGSRQKNTTSDGTSGRRQILRKGLDEGRSFQFPFNRGGDARSKVRAAADGEKDRRRK